MSLTLIRHTQPHVEAGICYGRTDLDVVASFHDEAGVVLANLNRPHIIVSSPLRRCLKLATFAASEFGLPVKIDPRFQEMDFGNWEGVAWSDIKRAELDLWAQDFLDARPHGGENVRQLRTRVHAGLAEYKNTGKHTLIFTHAGVVKATLAQGDHASDFDTSIPFGGIVNIPQNLIFRSAP